MPPRRVEGEKPVEMAREFEFRFEQGTETRLKKVVDLIHPVAKLLHLNVRLADHGSSFRFTISHREQPEPHLFFPDRKDF